MRRDPRAYLWDACEAGAAIETFTQGIGDGAAYAANALVWTVVQDSLPPLLAHIRHLLDELGQP